MKCRSCGGKYVRLYPSVLSVLIRLVSRKGTPVECLKCGAFHWYKPVVKPVPVPVDRPVIVADIAAFGGK